MQDAGGTVSWPGDGWIQLGGRANEPALIDGFLSRGQVGTVTRSWKGRARARGGGRGLVEESFPNGKFAAQLRRYRACERRCSAAFLSQRWTSAGGAGGAIDAVREATADTSWRHNYRISWLANSSDRARWSLRRREKLPACSSFPPCRKWKQQAVCQRARTSRMADFPRLFLGESKCQPNFASRVLSRPCHWWQCKPRIDILPPCKALFGHDDLRAATRSLIAAATMAFSFCLLCELWSQLRFNPEIRSRPPRA